MKKTTALLTTLATLGGYSAASAAEPKQEQETNAAGQVEVLAGHEATTLDAKLFVSLPEGFGLLSRNKVSASYQGEVSPLSINSLGYRLVGNNDVALSMVAETDILPSGVDPRVGLQFSGRYNDFSALVLGEVGISENPDGSLLTILSYNPKLTDNVKFDLRAENLTKFNGDGHVLSKPMLRAGVQYKMLKVGAGVDCTMLGNKPTIGCNAGGYIAVGGR